MNVSRCRRAVRRAGPRSAGRLGSSGTRREQDRGTGSESTGQPRTVLAAFGTRPRRSGHPRAEQGSEQPGARAHDTPMRQTSLRGAAGRGRSRRTHAAKLKPQPSRRSPCSTVWCIRCRFCRNATYIFIVPFGPRLDFSTPCRPVAAPMLSWSAWAARATSAFGFSVLIADMMGQRSARSAVGPGAEGGRGCLGHLSLHTARFGVCSLALLFIFEKNRRSRLFLSFFPRAGVAWGYCFVKFVKSRLNHTTVMRSLQLGSATAWPRKIVAVLGCSPDRQVLSTPPLPRRKPDRSDGPTRRIHPL